MSRLRAFLAASLLALALPAAANANLSDTWWNPQESGSGLQLVQQGETAFVTLYTYGSNNEPLWFVAPDAHIFAISGSNGLPSFRGTLYRARGTAFSDAYKPGDTQVIPVGEIFLTATADNALEVEYTVNNVTVTKSLVRQTLSMPSGGPFFAGTFTLRQSQSDGGTPFGTREYNADFLLFVDGDNTAVLRVSDAVNGLCQYSGPYTQAGRYGAFAGSYSCESGESGTFSVKALSLKKKGVTAVFNTTGRDGFGRRRFDAVSR